MGQEARCRLQWDGQVVEGVVLLETDEVIFRGKQTRRALRVAIPYHSISAIRAYDGRLELRTLGGEVAVFALGPIAQRWAERLRHPKSRLEKLGVKIGQRIGLAGEIDPAFRQELVRLRRVELVDDAPQLCDLIFLALRGRRPLARLEELKGRLSPSGAIWVIRPKGRPDVTERDVMDAAKAAGLVDVKVVRFSDTHTAEKLVIPVAERAKAAGRLN